MPLSRIGPPLGTCVFVDDCEDSLPLNMMVNLSGSLITLWGALNASLVKCVDKF